MLFHAAPPDFTLPGIVTTAGLYPFIAVLSSLPDFALLGIVILWLSSSAQRIIHPAIASSALSNLSLPGLVPPLLSASYCHCSVLSHCTTVIHAVLIVPPLAPSALV
ncbi:hypothetical protein B0H10DRAFT_2220699 [Mycena sp. CBHHK59/15]|nr:hypothetical protein B0H10DRAFT_2220699 [Mycena sp. CBHHK59/15]